VGGRADHGKNATSTVVPSLPDEDGARPDVTHPGVA
jgi:hypothetical protein